MTPTDTEHTPPTTTVLWDIECDTYTAPGYQLVEDVEAAIRPIIAPLMAAWCDASHLGSLVTEAAGRAVSAEWNRRQDHA